MKMTQKMMKPFGWKQWTGLLLSLLLVFSMAMPALALEVDGETEARIRELIGENYFQVLDPETVRTMDLDELLGSLDQHSGYLSAEEFGAFQSSVEGRFGGIGIQLTTEQSRVVITGVIPGSPAAQVGIQIGDKIRAVNGVDVRNVPQAELVPLLRGDVGTSVVLEVDRGESTVLFSISRRIIDVSGKVVRLDEEGIGYFAFHTFGSDTGGWFTGHVIKQKLEGMHGVILDLRGNPGGTLGSGLNVAAALLDRDEVITRIYSRGEEQNNYRSTTPGFDGPVVVLTDRASASASEFVTGALKDNLGALQVGGTTYGKGRIQSAYLLPDGGRLKITTAEYRSPDGVVIDGVGLVPDVVLEDPQDQLDYAYQYLRGLVRFYGFETLNLVTGSRMATVNGEELQMPAAARQQAGRTLVPLRFVGDALRVDVSWQPDGSIRLANDRQQLDLQVGMSRGTLDGEVLVLDVPVQVVDGISYIPLRVLVESFGYRVNFDPATGGVTVEK